MENLESVVSDVCRVAREAGLFLKEERKSFCRSAVHSKHAHDYVSYVDEESERRVVTALKQLLPEAGFITEEGSAVWQGESCCWVVDPLDGTTNYIHDVSPYCVSIALRSRNELLLGVVYEPVRDECFYAWKGGGAYVNGTRMHVSGIPSLEEACVVVELPYGAERYARTGEHLIRRLYGRVAAVRMNGSAALALCYVAAGRYDAWLEAFIGRWDFSAGVLMVREAGGTVTDFYGNPSILDSHHIVAATPALYRPLFDVLHEALPEGM